MQKLSDILKTEAANTLLTMSQVIFGPPLSGASLVGLGAPRPRLRAVTMLAARVRRKEREKKEAPTDAT